MRKNLQLLLIVFSSCFIQLKGQISLAGTEEYGRLFHVTYDEQTENKIYATTLYNHLLVSEDNGESWNVLYSFPISSGLEIHDLKQIDENTLTFEVYNVDSVDNYLVFFDLNTQTVTQTIYPPDPELPPNAPYTQNEIKSYDVFRGNQDIVLFHVSYNFGLSERVYYTQDGGENWNIVYDFDDYSIVVNNVAINPSNPDKLYLARGGGQGHDRGGLFVSEDAGQNWTQNLIGITFDAIEFHPNNPDNILIGTYMNFSDDQEESVYQTLDGGQNWEALPIVWTAEGSLNHVSDIKINPTNTNKILVLEENEILVSDDRGGTWTSYPYTDIENSFEYYAGLWASFNPFVEDEVIITGDNYPYRSFDSGASIEQMSNPYFRMTGGMGLFQNEEEKHLYYGVQEGYIHYDFNSGLSQASGVMPLRSYAPSSLNQFIADKNVAGRTYRLTNGFPFNRLIMSDDHGQNYTNLLSNFNNRLSFAQSYTGNTNWIYVILSNMDENNSFLKMDITDINNITFDEILLPQIGASGGLYVNPENSDQMTISLKTNIYKTMDGGLNWELFNSGLENLNPDYDYILDMKKSSTDENLWTIATSQGIFISNDDAENWELKYEGVIQRVELSPFNEDHIIGVIHTSNASMSGIVFSKDKGETWEEISSEDLEHIAVTRSEVAFSETEADVYLGTYDLGVVKISLDLETLSVSEPELISGNHAVIYPNPATDVLNIQTKVQIDSIEIYDLSGQKILSAISDKVNISHLNRGVYLVKINTQDGQTETQKFIKK